MNKKKNKQLKLKSEIQSGQSTLLNLLASFKTSLKKYVDQPSEENLKALIHISEEYREFWIKAISEDGGLGQIKPSDTIFSDIIVEKNEPDVIKKQNQEKQKGILSTAYMRARLDLKKSVQKDQIFRAESPDKKTKLLTYSIFIPSGEYLDSETFIDEQDFIHHSVRAERENKTELGKQLNRRWYFEQG